MFSCQSCRCWREHNRRTRGHRTKGSRGWRRCSKRKRWRDVGSNGIQSSGRIWEQASTEGTLWFIRLLLIDSKATAIFTGCNSLLFVCWQVHRVLPQWLAQPDMIHRDIKSNLVPLADVPEISAKLVKKLHNNGIQHLFPGNVRFRSIVDILKLWQEQMNILSWFKTALTFQQYKRRWSLPSWKVHNRACWLDEVATSPEISVCLRQQAVARHWHLSYLLYRWAADILFRLRDTLKRIWTL